jgi:hypothetical protein
MSAVDGGREQEGANWGFCIASATGRESPDRVPTSLPSFTSHPLLHLLHPTTLVSSFRFISTFLLILSQALNEGGESLIILAYYSPLLHYSTMLSRSVLGYRHTRSQSMQQSKRLRHLALPMQML